MTRIDRTAEARALWADHNERQVFEHNLIDRKTTWLLASQTILMAAYGVSLNAKQQELATEFRAIVTRAGLIVALLTLVGVVAIINSKRISWQDYKNYYAASASLPKPYRKRPLQWGVRTPNTWVTLLPDAFLPAVFIMAWSCLL
jgi:hypothetical protein